jgi:hypothetical protein
MQYIFFPFFLSNVSILQTEIDTHLLHFLHINLNTNYDSAVSTSTALTTMHTMFARTGGSWRYTAIGDMPMVAFVQKAQPTLYKEVKRTAPEKKKKKDGKCKSGKGGGDSDKGSNGNDTSASRKQFDDRALRKKYRVNNGESGKVWSETLESAADTKIVSRIDNRTFSKLPLSISWKKSESKVVGFASQGFHVPTNNDALIPGYIAGNAVLTPRGSYNNGNMLGGPSNIQVKGWLVPPETGDIMFWIHSDDKGEFWLSTNSHAVNKVLLSCKPMSIETRHWTGCTDKPISLVARHKYYSKVRKWVIFTMF